MCLLYSHCQADINQIMVDQNDPDDTRAWRDLCDELNDEEQMLRWDQSFSHPQSHDTIILCYKQCSDINHCATSLDPWDSHQPICQVFSLKMLYTVFTNTNNPSLHFLELTDEWWKQWVVGKYKGICLLHVTSWIETLTRLLRLQTSYNKSFNRKHALFEW